MSRTVTDQMGRQVAVPNSPSWILSVVPSQTELLFDLGLDEEVAGITKFCIHPEEKFRVKPRFGGTKKLHLDRIEALQPDLIIGNKEENSQSDIEWLMERFPVWMSDIHSLEDAYAMIESVGQLVDRSSQAEAITGKVRQGFAELTQESGSGLKVAYLIWQNPWMVAGQDTFIQHLIERCGWQNVFTSNQGRYPEVSAEQLRQADPQVILLSSEPFPFKEKHIVPLQKICPEAVIKTVDGELFSWYGSRLLHTPAYLKKLISDLGKNFS